MCGTGCRTAAEPTVYGCPTTDARSSAHRKTCELPYRSPSFVGPKVVLQIPRPHFPGKGEFGLGCTPLTPRPLFMQVPGGSCGIITTGHRGHGAIVPNGPTCRHFLTNPSCAGEPESSGGTSNAAEPARARQPAAAAPGPGEDVAPVTPPAGAVTPASAVCRCSNRKTQQRPPHPSTPAAARRRVLGAAGQRAPSPRYSGTVAELFADFTTGTPDRTVHAHPSPDSPPLGQRMGGGEP